MLQEAVKRNLSVSSHRIELIATLERHGVRPGVRSLSVSSHRIELIATGDYIEEPVKLYDFQYPLIGSN